MLTKLLAVVASLASAVVVRDAAEFRAELARGAPSIELADNLYLEGEELKSDMMFHAPRRNLVTIGQVTGVHIDAANFSYNSGQILRAFLLYEGETLIQGSHFLHHRSGGGVSRRRRRGQYESRLKAGHERAKASTSSREAWARQRWLET